jgi:hypothetical protein
MVTFHLFVHMAIRKLAGYAAPQLPTAKARVCVMAKDFLHVSYLLTNC